MCTFEPKLEGPAEYLFSAFHFMTFAYLMGAAMNSCQIKFLLSG
jgi:hypothetical protein